MMKRSFVRATALTMALLVASASVAADVCDTAVASALDQQREQYISASADLADQNFSRRPGTFASTTCLDTLMQQGGVDIFFKPPSLDNILNLVKNFACEQASQIFDKLTGGSGSQALQVGELLAGVSLGGITSAGGGASSILKTATSTKPNVDVSLRKLFQ